MYEHFALHAKKKIRLTVCHPFFSSARPQADLYGNSFFSSAQIDSYIDWSLVNLEVPALLQVLPLMGRMEKNFMVVKKAQADFENGLKRLEADLALRTFIVGDRLSLADVRLLLFNSVCFCLILFAFVCF